MPPPAPPDIAFGNLPKLKFPETAVVSSGFSYFLENIEGKPPETTASARVFLMPKKTYTFESGENANKLAKSLNFQGNAKVDTVYYYFINENNPNLTLFVDSTNLNFQYKYNYANNPEIFQIGIIPSVEEAEKNAREFLNFSRLWDDSIFEGKTVSEVLIYDDRLKKFVDASSLSNSNAVRVNYFRKEIDEFSLVSDEFNRSHNYLIYANTQGTELNNILEISYFFWPIDFNSFASYPLLSGEEAYQALLEGKVQVINRGENNSEITIRKIYLAYYDSAIPQTYLQPIFVFEGDNNFVAYLPAIRSEYFQ